MGEPSPQDEHQDSNQAQHRAEHGALHRMSRLLHTRRVRFWIIVLVAFLWLFAECTHRSRPTKTAEPLPEFNVTTLSTITSSAAVPNYLEPRGSTLSLRQGRVP